MPKHTHDNAPRQVDWATILELMENAPALKHPATAQTTQHGASNAQPAA